MSKPPPVPNWLKGNLPTWLVVGMLSLNLWFIKRHIEQIDYNDRTLFTMGYDHENRITKIESRPLMGFFNNGTNKQERQQ